MEDSDLAREACFEGDGGVKSSLKCWDYWHFGVLHYTCCLGCDPCCNRPFFAEMVITIGNVLKMGASINLYMFHGGTNFGFMNGAVHFEEYKPDITSYGEFPFPVPRAHHLESLQHRGMDQKALCPSLSLRTLQSLQQTLATAPSAELEREKSLLSGSFPTPDFQSNSSI